MGSYNRGSIFEAVWFPISVPAGLVDTLGYGRHSTR